MPKLPRLDKPQVLQQLPRTDDVRSQAPSTKRFELDPSSLDASQLKPPPDNLLADMIGVGLARLTDGRYQVETQGTLNFLVETMAGASGPDSRAIEDAVAQVKGGFSKLLRGMVSITPETLQTIREDVPTLVDLAVVALGAGKGGTDQLVANLDVIKGGLSDLLAMTPESRSAHIAKVREDFGWAAQVFSRGESALQAANSDAPNRLQAIAGIFQIIAKYAGDA